MIKIQNVSKKYNLGKQDSLLYNRIGNFFKKASNHSSFWALKNIFLDINEGDIIGIIGRNGAGKSTLLKILSRITEPTYGKIEMKFKPTSLLEVGTGFHQELTGRENIFLNGSILGMKQKEIKLKLDEIIAFSGVEKFIDTPVKHYSSGMYVRLAFSVAAHLDSKILIVDEVLSVGDADFQKKSLGKMNEASKSGKTVLFVSHNMGAVRELCTEALLLESGKIKKKGSVHEVIDLYYGTNKTINNNNNVNSIIIKNIKLLNYQKQQSNNLKFGEPFYIKSVIKFPSNELKLSPSFFIKNSSGIQILTSRALDIDVYIEKQNQDIIEVSGFYKNLFLTPGIYYISMRINGSSNSILDMLWDILEFRITEESFSSKVKFKGGYGLLANQPIWNIKGKI